MRHVVPALVFLLSSLVALADDKAPTAEEILDRSAKAQWGSDYKALKSLRVSGKVSMGAAGVNGTFLEERKAPNKTHMHMELQGMKVDEGYDGTTAWSNDPMGGLRKKEASEEALEKFGADFFGDLDWKTRYKKVTLKGEEDLDGKKAWALTLEAEGVGEIEEWIDEGSSLPVKQVMTVDVPQGKMTVEATISDYHPLDAKAFPKVMVPGKMTQKMGPQVMEMTFEKIEANVDLDDKLFAMPEEKGAEPPKK